MKKGLAALLLPMMFLVVGCVRAEPIATPDYVFTATQLGSLRDLYVVEEEAAAFYLGKTVRVIGLYEATYVGSAAGHEYDLQGKFVTLLDHVNCFVAAATVVPDEIPPYSEITMQGTLAAFDTSWMEGVYVADCVIVDIDVDGDPTAAMTAQELYDAFARNPVAAADEYLNRYVRITGVIMDVAAGYCRLLLEDEEQIVIVWFATAADTAGLQDGDDVVLQGAVLLGNEDRYIELQQATLIDDAE